MISFSFSSVCIDVDYTVCLQELVQSMNKEAIESKIYVQKSQEIQNAFGTNLLVSTTTDI